MARRIAGSAIAACVALAGLLVPAAAQSVDEFYKGRTVTLVISFGAGGLNDIAGRLVAQHLPRFIPGHPRIIAQNMPGAGGLVAANHLYNAAAQDGSVLMQLDRSVAQSERQRPDHGRSPAHGGHAATGDRALQCHPRGAELKPGGPIPKFVSVCGTLKCELRNQRITNNFYDSSAVLNLKFL
jgi:hypothetical protein